MPIEPTEHPRSAQRELRRLREHVAHARPQAGPEALRRARLVAGVSLADSIQRHSAPNPRGSIRRPLLYALPAPIAGIVVWLLGGDVAVSVAFAALAYAVAAGALLVYSNGFRSRSLRSELALAATFDRLVADTGAFPPGVTEQIDRVRETLASILPRLAAVGATTVVRPDDAYVVRAVIERYLPDALAAWRQLGPAGAGDGALSLMHQLSSMADQLGAIDARIAAHWKEQLEINRRLVASR